MLPNSIVVCFAHIYILCNRTICEKNYTLLFENCKMATSSNVPNEIPNAEEIITESTGAYGGSVIYEINPYPNRVYFNDDTAIVTIGTLFKDVKRQHIPERKLTDIAFKSSRIGNCDTPESELVLQMMFAEYEVRGKHKSTPLRD